MIYWNIVLESEEHGRKIKRIGMTRNTSPAKRRAALAIEASRLLRKEGFTDCDWSIVRIWRETH